MSNSSSSILRPQNIPLGIGLMVFAVFLFSVNDVVGKWLAGTYAAPQILLVRNFAAIVVLVPILGSIGWRSLVAVDRPWLQAFRAAIGAIEVAFFYWAVSYLPLADAMTFYLAAPIYVTVMAALFLGERVGWRRWTAVLAGFGGVVIALGPSASAFGWVALIPFVGSVFYALFLVTTRVLRGTSDVVMAAWQIIAGFILGVVVTPMAWRPFDGWVPVVLLCLLGCVSLIAVVAVNRSLAVAPASVVVPYQYMLIIWAVLFGYIVFGDVPSPAMLIGAAIIVAAGLFIFLRETKLGLEPKPEVPPDR
jgi:drug/metabolite transporter (DMT)-like permease